MTDWLSRLTAYGWVDLGSDVLLLTAAAVGLRWITQIRRDVTALRQSESYGQHAKGRGPR